MLPKTSTYVKSYDGETTWMNYSIEDDELIESYDVIWNKVSNSFKKELHCEPIYNKKFMKTKIRSYGKKATDFHIKEIPKVVFNYTLLAVISIDFVLKNDENYHQQVLLKECNTLKKK